MNKIESAVMKKAVALYKMSTTGNVSKSKEIIAWFAENAKEDFFRNEIAELEKIPHYKLQEMLKLPDTVKELTPKYTREELFLQPSTLKVIDDLKLEFKHRDLLQKHKTNHRSRVILHGPSGCGKTSIAHMLANELEIPLYVASHATTVDSHLGETNKNIEKMLSFVENKECVFLFDEFDSVAKSRGSGDVAEMSRVVNMLLTRLDSMEMKGIFIACTNRFEDIDVAIKRRFDVSMAIVKPSEDKMREMINFLLKGVQVAEMDLERVYNQIKDLSPAELTRICQVLKRNAIISKFKENE